MSTSTLTPLVSEADEFVSSLMAEEAPSTADEDIPNDDGEVGYETEQYKSSVSEETESSEVTNASSEVTNEDESVSSARASSTRPKTYSAAARSSLSSAERDILSHVLTKQHVAELPSKKVRFAEQEGARGAASRQKEASRQSCSSDFCAVDDGRGGKTRTGKQLTKAEAIAADKAFREAEAILRAPRGKLIHSKKHADECTKDEFHRSERSKGKRRDKFSGAKKTMPWLWLVLLLIIAVIIAYAWYDGTRDDTWEKRIIGFVVIVIIAVVAVCLLVRKR